jgi:hypothetical protein
VNKFRSSVNFYFNFHSSFTHTTVTCFLHMYFI